MTLSSTQILAAAVRVAPIVTTPRGTEIEYQPPLSGSLTGVCWLCGAQTEQGHKRSQAIKESFMDTSYARAPSSDVVCDACTWALSLMSLRNYSIVATERRLEHPSRVRLRELFAVEPPATPYMACVAVSGQKWLHFKAPVGYSREHWAVQFENEQVKFGPLQFLELLVPIEMLLQIFSKGEVETGNYNQARISKFSKVESYSLALWESMEQSIAPRRGSRLFDLVLFVAKLPDKEEQRRSDLTHATGRES